MSTIRAIRTLRLGAFPNLLWVEIEDGAGATGLGETFFGPRAVEAYIHETAAPLILGGPADPEPVRAALHPYVGHQAAGAELRGASAIDIALWDLRGRRADAPLWSLLGGRVRERIRAYNTCAGYAYVRRAEGQSSANWGLGAAAGPYEDLAAFLSEAGTLARSLRAEGYTAMKIWPFDRFAEASRGAHVAPDELEAGLRPFRQIRDAVGGEIDIYLELHGLWLQSPALRIAEAVAPFGVGWIEDPVRMHGVSALADFRARSPLPVTASETIAGRAGFRELLAAGAVDHVMLDVAWCGGVTEAKAVAALAEAWGRPVAPHDCTGPVTWAASCHLAVHLPNAMIQECVRALFTGWYPEVAEGLPEVAGGFVAPAPAAGHGVRLRPGVARRADATVTESRA